MSNPFDKESLSQREKDILEDGGWQCSFCATVNANYITTCSCSHNRDDSYENLHGRYVPREDEEWSEAGIMVEGPAETIQTPPSAASAATFQTPPSTSSASSFQTPPSAATFQTPSADTPFQPVVSEPEFERTSPEPAGSKAAVSEPPAMPEAPKPKAPVSNTNRPIEEYTEYEQGILKDGGWECAFCARINASYITTCACGHSTDDSYLKRRGKYVDPDGEEQESTETESAVSPSVPEISPAAAPKAEKTGAEMIAEIEEELQKNDSPTARLRAIRKLKDLNKKGFMSAEELNHRMDELMGFDEDEEPTEQPGEETTAATAEDSAQEEDALELL